MNICLQRSFRKGEGRVHRLNQWLTLTVLAIAALTMGASQLMAADQIPFIYSPLSPGHVAPGAKTFTLTVYGTGFVSGATVYWNGASLTTTFKSSSELTASVPAANAQIALSIGVQPVCSYGYYDYSPYACAPVGFYGPGYFYNGIFLGMGPWAGWGYGHGWGEHRFSGGGGGRYSGGGGWAANRGRVGGESRVGTSASGGSYNRASGTSRAGVTRGGTSSGASHTASSRGTASRGGTSGGTSHVAASRGGGPGSHGGGGGASHGGSARH